MKAGPTSSATLQHAQLCSPHWVQGSPLPPAAQAIILSGCAYLPTMNTQLVVPLPPIFSIANFFAFSTW
jgi:hypothetical protein